MILSPKQRAAVERKGHDVCVVAGPGSGKTRVLIERFAWLVEQRGFDPARILAITFTEKAANEMKARLVKRFAQRPDLREHVERAWLSTIDGFCARLLSENAIAAGLPPDFTVLDQPSADQMRREAAEQALDELFAQRPADARRLMESLDLSTDDDMRQPDLAESLLDAYESMRLSGIGDLPPASTPPDVLPAARELALTIQNDHAFGELHDWTRDFLRLPKEPISLEHFHVLKRFHVNLGRGSKSRPGYQAASQFKKTTTKSLEAQWTQSWYAGLPELLRGAISRLDYIYRDAKRQQAAVDFADLEEKAIALLESDQALHHRIENQFDQVLMDELQDTNRLQWRLVNLIRTPRKFFAVGDINQSIYGFRHADRTVFEEYRASLRAEGFPIDELDDNYRSRPEILHTVLSVLNGQPGIEHRQLRSEREFDAANGAIVERLVGIGNRAEDAEAELVAARIRELRLAGYKLSDFAILVRTLASTAPFERALDRLGIPFLVSGGRTFLEARETKDLLNFAAALVNPLDDIAMLGVLRSPLIGWSDEEILRAGREGWQAEFERLFGSARRMAGFLAPDLLVAKALDECGYLLPLTDRARANVDKLLAWMRREHRSRPRPLAELLEDMETLRTARTEAEAPPPEATEAVRIMSIHAAKGLEFPVVFVSALHRGPDRRTPVILFSADLGVGAKWRNPVTGAGVSDASHAEMAQRRKIDEEAEENRLLYVAMTRPEHRLILSYAERKQASKWQKLAEAGVQQVTQAESLPPAERLPGVHTQEEPIVCPAPAVTGQYDSSVAVTAVALFEACPRKYYLGRYLGLEASARDRGSGAIDLGLEVHRALAGLATNSAEAMELAQRFTDSELGQRAARANRLEHEFDFMLAQDDVILRGQIDLWFEESGELILVDYKTGRDELSVAEYSLQMRLYALALERYAGRIPDRAVLCFLRSERFLEVGVTKRDLDAAKDAVRKLAQAQDNLEFPMKAGEQCRRCSFYEGLCPSSGLFSEPPSYALEQPTTDS